MNPGFSGENFWIARKDGRKRTGYSLSREIHKRLGEVGNEPHLGLGLAERVL
jgi:hypothetical protein